MKAAEEYVDQLVHVETVARKPAVTRPYPAFLSPAVTKGLSAAGIPALFSHQVEGLEAVRRGDPAVIVATSTSSGKSLVYTLPIAEALLRGDRSARQLLIFPTKALAHDQLAKLKAMLSPAVCPGVKIATMDGDTPFAARKALMADSHLILTNPDMLHLTILPKHKEYAALLRQLRFVVVDEAHMYVPLSARVGVTVLNSLALIHPGWNQVPRRLRLARGGDLSEAAAGVLALRGGAAVHRSVDTRCPTQI